jgi:hypothetical protein
VILGPTARTAGAARAGPATTRGANAVRPFDSWLVRTGAAAVEVTAMSEVAVAARAATRPVHPEAYEPMSPALYVYRQRTPHAEHTGIVCDITPEAFLDGRVRGHESVQADRVDALARYLTTAPQRVELVSTLHRAGPVLRATLASTRRCRRGGAGKEHVLLAQARLGHLPARLAPRGRSVRRRAVTADQVRRAAPGGRR